MYGALVTAADSTRTRLHDGVLAAFAPRTGPPSTATVLRSVLWPAAILSVLHRSIILTANGNITDDFKPVYRAALNFRHGWDIYNEHFDYVDPHYLYPPGGTLLMAPFGFLPFAPSRYLFILINTVAILLAWYLLLRLFKYTLASVAAPALLLAMFCTESVTSTLVFTNINGCILLLEVLFLRWLLDGRISHQWWAGLAIGLTLVLKPVLGPLLLLPLLNRQWRALVPAIALPVVVNLAALPLVSDPKDFVTRTVPYILGTRDYFNSSIEGNGVYFGLPTWLIVFLRILFTLLAIGSSVAAVPLLPHPRPAVLVHHLVGRAAAVVVAGAVAVPGLLLDDAVPVPDDGGAAQLADPQLAGVAGDLRLHDAGQLAALQLDAIRPRAAIPEDHLRLVAAADRGVHGAVLPLPGRQGGEPAGRRVSIRRGWLPRASVEA